MKKLFDLQTGKYLELGKDWLDGGEYIKVAHESYKELGLNLKNDDFRLHTFEVNPNHELNSRWKEMFKGCIHTRGDNVNIKVRQFEVEGKTYTLGDIFQVYLNKRGDYMFDARAISFPTINIKYNQNGEIIKLGSFKVIKVELYGNILEEYSKSLRGEENRLEEFEKLLGF